MGFQLAADARDRVRIETRLRQRQPHELERKITMLGQCLEEAAEIVEIGVEAEADREVIETTLKSLAVQIARALVQQRRSHSRETRFVARVGGRAAAAKGETHGDDGIRMVLDQPGLDTIRGDPLDLHCL